MSDADKRKANLDRLRELRLKRVSVFLLYFNGSLFTLEGFKFNATNLISLCSCIFVYSLVICRIFLCGFRSQNGRDGDSGSKWPGFKSRRWADFQRLHLCHRRPSVNGELRGTASHAVSLCGCNLI